MSRPLHLEAEFIRAREALDGLMSDPAYVETTGRFCAAVGSCFERGGKVLAIGNGGSACDAMHFCEELTGRFRAERRPLPAIACVDAGYLTCAANDYGYEAVFSRWVEGLGQKGDVLVALSTSGNSPNVIRAVEAARSRGMAVACLLGKDGGRLRGASDFEWIVPGQTTDRIQELHMLILHASILGIERVLGLAGEPATERRSDGATKGS